MSFIQAYKRLEKLCGEIYGEGRISAYIETMENTPQGAYTVNGWQEDLKQLKHYRWVRNQIAHSPDCTEENMCVFSDTEWVIDFYNRIMDQTDPLALYNKPKDKPSKRQVFIEDIECFAPYLSSKKNTDTPSNGMSNVGKIILAFALVFAAVAICLIAKNA